MASRVPEWIRRWAALDPATRDKAHAVVQEIKASTLVADRKYHFQSYPKCLVCCVALCGCVREGREALCCVMMCMARLSRLCVNGSTASAFTVHHHKITIISWILQIVIGNSTTPLAGRR